MEPHADVPRGDLGREALRRGAAPRGGLFVELDDAAVQAIQVRHDPSAGAKSAQWGPTPTPLTPGRSDSLFAPGSLLAPAEGIPPSTAASSATTTSKNDIFLVSHVISKPATKATEAELESLRRGESLPSTPGAGPNATPVSPGPAAAGPGDGGEKGAAGGPAPGSIGRLVLLRQVDSLSRADALSGLPALPTAVVGGRDGSGGRLQLAQFLPSALCAELELDTQPVRLIGEGTGGQVYLWRYRRVPPSPAVTSPDEASFPLSPPPPPPKDPGKPGTPDGEWTLCAVKRLPATDEGLLMALNEVYMLHLLNGCGANVVRLIGIQEDPRASSGARQRSHTPGPTSMASSAPHTYSLSRRRMQQLNEPFYHVLLEYAEHGNLWQYVSAHPAVVSRQQWLRWARELAQAVAVMHDHGIVHHDIKPQNILLSRDFRGVLCDFGSARFVPAFQPQSEHPLGYFGASPRRPSTSSADSAGSALPSGIPRTAPLPIQRDDLASARLARSRSLHSGQPGSAASLGMSPAAAAVAAAAAAKTASSPTSSLYSLRDGLGRGTQAYSAPEMLTLDGEYSMPVDVYSVGVTLYALLSLNEPFNQARSGVEMLMGIKKGFFESGLQSPVARWTFPSGEPVTEDIRALVLSCLSRDPAQRPTAAALLDSLLLLHPPPPPPKDSGAVEYCRI